MGKMLLPNVYDATTPSFSAPVIVKLARFPWETDYYDQETQASSWIEGHDIAPKFLGHVAEGERVAGFLLEKVHGRQAGRADLRPCQNALARLHALGILHGDVNRHDFLVQPSRAYLVDFETARKTDEQQALDSELESLEGHICSDSRRGGGIIVSSRSPRVRSLSGIRLTHFHLTTKGSSHKISGGWQAKLGCGAYSTVRCRDFKFSSLLFSSSQCMKTHSMEEETRLEYNFYFCMTFS
jgi:hypothetical protein